MAKHNHTIFYAALVLSFLIHMLAVTPVSKWLNRTILPSLTDHTLEIDLSEVKTPVPSSPGTSSSKASPPAQPEPDRLDKPLPRRENILPPTSKKNLDANLAEDQTHSQQKQSDTKQRSADVSRHLEQPAEESLSPLFIRKPQQKQEKKATIKKEPVIPEEIKETFRNGSPEKTDDDKLEYSMNSYKWTFRRYMENWVVDIQKWWKAPLDYAMGNVPEGGGMWIQVQLAKSGKLLGYRIVKSEVTAEMELRVIQALVGSLERPALPESFPKEWLLINWHFIYPPLRPQLDMGR